MLQKAIQIAVESYQGQVDKQGHPYILHALRVMQAGATEAEKICGMLHDVVEDTDWTFDQLQAEGFSEEIINTLRCVTKLSEDEDYDQFISRIKQNPLAIKVKINDLRDNMDITRLKQITDKACDAKLGNLFFQFYLVALLAFSVLLRQLLAN